jgi:hypothetical protein
VNEDYLLFRKQRFDAGARICASDELFISAFNSSPRVQGVYECAQDAERRWIVLPEYQFDSTEIPAVPGVITCAAGSEASGLIAVLDTLGDLTGRKVVVDVTGFLNNYVMVFLPLLKARGVRVVRFIYGEPGRYLMGERTKFSDEVVMQVRQVGGFEGSHAVDSANDLLILGMGYDWRLAAQVAVAKEHARKVQLFGLPSLQPDMYQESLLCASRVEDEIGPEGANPINFEFAPAHDPFVTAATISEIVKKHRSRHPAANVYLSPLATKAQALGFALFYMKEAKDTPTSVIYPICANYMKATSEGLAGIWAFEIELDAL